MINYDFIRTSIKEDNLKRPKIFENPYIILKFGRSAFWKTNLLFNLIIHQPDIDQICLYAKDPYEAKYQLLINKKESIVLNHFSDSKAFI